jgi:SAM-dependent methyltransferase
VVRVDWGYGARMPTAKRMRQRVEYTWSRLGLIPHRWATPLRRYYYVDRSIDSLVARVPSSLRAKLGLDDVSAIGSRRLELGSGSRPHEGFIHVDLDRNAKHVELVAPLWRLLVPDNWAEEVLAIHTLEHIHPARLKETLREWFRVLKPGGEVRVHVPNSPELMERFLKDEPVEDKWRVMGALLGTYVAPGVSAPEEVPTSSDHQVLFDRRLLRWALEVAGFAQLKDRTEELSDIHVEAWRHVVPHMSLIFSGAKPLRSA